MSANLPKDEFLDFNDAEVRRFLDHPISPKGVMPQMLPHGKPASRAFPRLVYQVPQGPGRAPSLDTMELTKLFSSELQLPESQALVFYLALALATFYLRGNAIKLFDLHTHEQLPNLRHLRTRLLTLASKYYGQAISRLSQLIVQPDYDVSTAIFASSYLNKVSTYEYADMSHSIAFSKGTAGIFNDSVLRGRHHDIEWTIKFLIMAWRLYYFPAYTPKILIEYHEYLTKFMDLVGGALPGVGFHARLLLSFVNQLISWTSSAPADQLRHPSLVYRVLRQFLLIIPSKVPVMRWVKDPVERTLLYLYATLARMLDSMFPVAMYLFFQLFRGGLNLFFNPEYGQSIDVHDLLYDIQAYCIRVLTFFQKRFNVMVCFFGNQVYDEPVPIKFVRLAINEIMIERFTGVCIEYSLYHQFPRVVKLNKSHPAIQANLTRIHAMNLYHYNFEHYTHFRSALSNKTMPFVDLTDPMLMAHLDNTYQRDDDGDTSGETTPFDEMFEPCTTSLSPTSNNDPSPVDRAHYGMVLLPDIATQLSELICQEYTRILVSGRKNRPDPSPVLNPLTGLNVNDKDPLLVIRSPVSVLLAGQNDHVKDADRHTIIEFYRSRNDYLSQFNHEVSYEDDVVNFYNDLSEMYYAA